MDHRDARPDLIENPSNDVVLLIQRIRDLQRQKDIATRGKDNLFLSIRGAEREIRSFLEELDIDEALFPITESEDIHGLLGTLFLLVKMLCHEVECRGRDQRRLHRTIEAFQRKARQLANDKRTLEMGNTELEMRLDLLEDEARRAKKKRNRRTQ